jgi:hypothetical protein
LDELNDAHFDATGAAVKMCGEMRVELLNAPYVVWSVDEMRDLDPEDARLLSGTLLHLAAEAPWCLGRLRRSADEVTGFETASVVRPEKGGRQ